MGYLIKWPVSVMYMLLVSKIFSYTSFLFQITGGFFLPSFTLFLHLSFSFLSNSFFQLRLAINFF